MADPAVCIHHWTVLAFLGHLMPRPDAHCTRCGLAYKDRHT